MADTGTHSTPVAWLEAWHVDPSVNRDYEFIDGLRGIAILMVLCGHHFYFNPDSGPVIHFFGSLCGAGAAGVALFYALSGFLISWPFWKRKCSGAREVVPKGYARRRFWKIYPPLALSVVVLTPAYMLMDPQGSYVALAAQWLAGIPFLVPVSGRLNPVMWTLVIEVQFYMVLPLVFLLLKRVPVKAGLWIIPLLFLVVPPAFRGVTGQSATFHPEINSHFPAALDAFALGVLLAGLDNFQVLGAGWARLGLAGVVLWVANLLGFAWIDAHPQLQSAAWNASRDWIQKLASGLLVCYVANPRLPIPRFLCLPHLRWCGIVSYEWYLLHQPIALWSRHLFGPAQGNVLRYAAIVGGPLLLSGVLSALTYRYFSLPLLRYGRGKKR